MRRVPVLAAIAAIAAVATACTGPGSVNLKRLPDAPIAVMYREERMALDRVDAIRDLRKRQMPSQAEGVVRLETLDAMFGGTPEAQRKLAALEGHLALVDPRTGDATVLQGLPPGARPLGWSPDRSQLLIAGRWRDQMQLFVWTRATETAEIVSSGPREHPMGCLGPGGRLVAVQVWRVGRSVAGRLLATPPGGGGLRPLTPGPSDIQPTCSPKGTHVAYVTAAPDGGTAIAVLALDDPDAKPQIVAKGSEPVFSPDGEWIVYASRTASGKRLFRIRLDGAGRTAIGLSPDDEGDPAVSPDGAYVVYVVTDENDRERLRVRRYDGSGDRPLVTDGDASAPAW